MAKEEQEIERNIGSAKPLRKDSAEYKAAMDIVNEARSQVITARLNARDLALLKKLG